MTRLCSTALMGQIAWCGGLSVQVKKQGQTATQLFGRQPDVQIAFVRDGWQQVHGRSRCAWVHAHGPKRQQVINARCVGCFLRVTRHRVGSAAGLDHVSAW